MKNPLKEITNIVGEDHTLPLLSQETENYSVEGKKPSVVAFPKTVEEISQIMKVAYSESLAVIPWGGGTKIGLGRGPHKVDVVLCTKYLNRILEHEASDLVATAQCGISLKNFQTALGRKNQFLAINPPHIERGATLGGIIATNDSGPKRLKFGTMRELLIGIKVVRSDGSVVKGGAKVVKNVAGYNLPKLYVGSLGTLGIIVEGTFRLYPILEASGTLLATFPNLDMAQESVLSVLNSTLVPTCLEVLNPALVGTISEKLNLNIEEGKYAVSLRIESVEKAVRDQISKASDVCREKKGEGIILQGDFEENFWEEVREFPWRASGNNRTVCKAGVLITHVSKVFKVLDELSNNLGLRVYTSASAGNGILIMSVEGEISPLIEATKSLRGVISSLGGTLVIWEAPTSLKSEVDVWGETGAPLKVMERLKSLFDPNGILNPGRFIGGI